MDTALLCVLEVTVILIHIVQQHREKDALSPSQGGRGRWDRGWYMEMKGGEGPSPYLGEPRGAFVPSVLQVLV